MTRMPKRQIVACGGGLFEDDAAPLREFILTLARAPSPRVCFLPTASADHPEAMRRPVFRELVTNGFPAGVAAEDGVGLLYEGTDFVEAISWRPDGCAWRVGPESEDLIEVRTL